MTFTAVEDALVKKDDGNAAIADRAYESSFPTELRVRFGSISYRSYVKFQVSGLTGPVTSAKLRLNVTEDSPDGGRVYRVANSWSESSLTWNNAPPPGTQVGSAGAVAPGTVTVTLDPAIFTANGTYSFALANGSAISAIYSSSETTNPPRLILTTT